METRTTERTPAEINGSNCAFPCNLEWLDEGTDLTNPPAIKTKTAFGITKREFISVNAPNQIPDWFQHVHPAKNYTPQPDWKDVGEIFQKEVIDWLSDGTWDLPEELQWFQEKYNRHVDELMAWNKLNKQERYFQWRTFFADGMLNQLAR